MSSKKSQKPHYSQTIAPPAAESSKSNKKSESKKPESKATKESSAASTAPYATRLVRDDIATTKTDARTMLANLKAESSSSSSRQNASRLNRDDRQDATRLNRDDQQDATRLNRDDRQDATRLNRDDIEKNEIDWKTVSMVPKMPSQYKDNRDKTMASRQVNIESLPPNELAEQEKWAQQRLPEIGPCPAGFDWTRVENGYRCSGGSHFITHELLAAGIPGYYGMWHIFAVQQFGAMRSGRLGGNGGQPSVISQFGGMFGGSIPQGCNMIPADGHWWMGPIYIQAPHGRRNFGMAPLRSLMNGRPPNPGPGAPSPTPQDFGVSSWKEAGISFPKGMECKPGKGYGQHPDLRQLNPYGVYGGLGGYGGPGGYSPFRGGYGSRRGRGV